MHMTLRGNFGPATILQTHQRHDTCGSAKNNMPYLATSQEWSQQSLLLLQARPASVRKAPLLLRNQLTHKQTRITTKYKILDPSKETKRQRTSAPKKEPASTDASTSQPPTGPKGVLVLKTFDPVSGACLKYKTNKAAEVGRLIAGLGKLGREMAALPELPEGK